MLHDRDARTLARARRRQLPLLIGGALLFLLEPSTACGPWTGYTARRPRKRRLERLQPMTPVERSLLAELRAQADYTGRLLLFVLRFLVGSVVLTVGLMLLATTLAQRPLLSIFRRLRI